MIPNPQGCMEIAMGSLGTTLVPLTLHGIEHAEQHASRLSCIYACLSEHSHTFTEVHMLSQQPHAASHMHCHLALQNKMFDMLIWT